MAAAIRVAGVEDAAAMLDIYAPVVRASAISFEVEPPTLADFAERVRAIAATHPWLVYDDGGIAGYAYATTWRTRAAYAWTAETTVYVRADRQRRAVGRALYRSLLACLELAGHRLAIGGITLPNAASVALHESVGFVPLCVYRGVGFKRGRWHDVGWWHCRLAELPAIPAAPRPFSEMGSDYFSGSLVEK
jgi:L-amino acid N-acyltransferase YncA